MSTAKGVRPLIYVKGIGDYSGLHYSTVSGIIQNQKPDPLGESCSVFSARYLILMHTLFSILLVGAALGAALLDLPTVLAFIIILTASFAANQALAHAENVVCAE